jgi:hypothetical protein
MLSAALLVLAAAAPGAVYDPLFHGGFEQSSTCPAGRQLYSDIGYVGDNHSGDLRPHVYLAEWENIWGHADPYDTTVPWPGRANSAPVIADFDKNSYIAAHFVVPLGTPPTWLGWITHTDYNYGHNLTAAISTQCGDFSPPAQACFVQGLSGLPIVPWRTNTGSFCRLQPNTDYYLNIKMTNPNEPSPTCSSHADVCAIGTANALLQ